MPARQVAVALAEQQRIQMLTQAQAARLLTVKETATRLGLHPQTVRTKILRGEIPAVQLGGPGTSIRVDPAELELWLRDEGEAA
jgi:excisionase family DNA binding protein